jgi:hypothetical protein
MNNRITEAEYAHYALTYAAAKMSAPLPPHGTPREAVLSALAVDDAKHLLGVLPCMTNGEDGRHLVDLHAVDANGQKILALYYPRGYNIQELRDGLLEMGKDAHMQNIVRVSERLHLALTGERLKSASKDSDNLKSITDSIETIALKAVARSFQRATEGR